MEQASGAELWRVAVERNKVSDVAECVDYQRRSKMEKLINIKTFYSRREAETAKGLLDKKGIQSSILADDVGATNPSLAFTGGVRLLVNKADVKKAKEFIKVLGK